MRDLASTPRPLPGAPYQDHADTPGHPASGQTTATTLATAVLRHSLSDASPFSGVGSLCLQIGAWLISPSCQKMIDSGQLWPSKPISDLEAEVGHPLGATELLAVLCPQSPVRGDPVMARERLPVQVTTHRWTCRSGALHVAGQAAVSADGAARLPDRADLTIHPPSGATGLSKSCGVPVPVAVW